MKSNEALMERIKKLMALSHSSNPSEASIALARAQKLMAEHQISMDDISMSAIEEQYEEILPSLRDRILFTHLANIIGRAFGIEYFFSGNNHVYNKICFIGPQSRLEGACYTFTILARQAAAVKKSFAAKERKRVQQSIKDEILKASPEQVFRMCADYGFDLDSMIKNRVSNEVRRNTKAYVHGWLRAVKEKVIDFVTDEQEDKLIETFIKQHHPDLVTMRRSRTTFSHSQMQAYSQGTADGRDGFNLYHGVHGAPGTERLGFNG